MSRCLECLDVIIPGLDNTSHKNEKVKKISTDNAWLIYSEAKIITHPYYIILSKWEYFDTTKHSKDVLHIPAAVGQSAAKL